MNQDQNLQRPPAFYSPRSYQWPGTGRLCHRSGDRLPPGSGRDSRAGLRDSRAGITGPRIFPQHSRINGTGPRQT